MLLIIIALMMKKIKYFEEEDLYFLCDKPLNREDAKESDDTLAFIMKKLL